MVTIGIMQGRLTAPKGRGIQFFPFENWKTEFEQGKTLGIQEIEWIFDYEDYEQNPLWSKQGQKEILERIQHYGISVRSVCFDYFMRRAFYQDPQLDGETRKALRKENEEIFLQVLEGMKEIGAQLIEIPLVVSSSAYQNGKQEYARDYVEYAAKTAESMELLVSVETDFPVPDFRNFLDSIPSAVIRANYDSGNSSGLGYDHYKELLSLGHFVANVHIKDRVLGGTTVKLGTGSADFDKVFSGLSEISYSSSIILQAARGADGQEQQNIKSQMEFVRSYLDKYQIQ